MSLSYAAHEADSEDDYAEQDDYTVEKILARRPNASAPGGLEFKVRWRGFGPSPPPFRGWSWVAAAMLGYYQAPPRVCSKEGGEAVPRTYGPWPGGL